MSKEFSYIDEVIRQAEEKAKSLGFSSVDEALEYFEKQQNEA